MITTEYSIFSLNHFFCISLTISVGITSPFPTSDLSIRFLSCRRTINITTE
jgi:hypothetical protein